jgi:uncharacterized lipoprotein YehR (DUF1307 family)
MKNLVKLFGIIALIAIIGFAFIACDTGNNDNDDDGFDASKLVGTWKLDGGTNEDVIVFSESNDGYYLDVDGTDVDGTSELKDDIIHLGLSDSYTFKVAFEGEKLRISDTTGISSVDGLYTKQ